MVAVYERLAGELGGYGKLVLGVNTGASTGVLASWSRAPAMPAARRHARFPPIHPPTRPLPTPVLTPPQTAAEPDEGQRRGPRLAACVEAFRILRPRGLAGAFVWALENSCCGGYEAETALLQAAAE